MSRDRGLFGRCLIGLAAVALLAGAPAAAAAPAAPNAPASPPKPSPTAEEIVARYVAARGGLKKLQSIQTLRQSGHATTGAGRHGLVTRELKRPGRSRFEFTVQGVTAVFASDGQHGWKVSPFDGEMAPKPLPDEVVQEAAEQADIEGPLVDWKAKGHQVELAGREAVGDGEAWKIKLTLKSGAVLYDYLDVKSLYLLRTDSTRQVRGSPVQIKTTFGDYRKIGGILFPHLVEVEAVGRPQRLSVVVDKVEVNPTLSDALFEQPKSAQP
jgi:outer membrane lipoprotein-sorting protein